jgi:acyl carrier protein
MRETEAVTIIERIFRDTLSITPPAPEVDIIDAALLDSLGLVTLLFEIEQELGLQLPLESLEVDDFRSIALIARLMVRTRSAEQGKDFKGEGPVNSDLKGARSR